MSHVHSYQIIIKLVFRTFAIAECFDMLHAGSSTVCKFNGSFNLEWAVQQLSSNVAPTPDEATDTAISDLARTVIKIKDIRNVLPVPPGAASVAFIIILYTSFC